MLVLLGIVGCGAEGDGEDVAAEEVAIINCPAGESCGPGPTVPPTINLSLGAATASSITATWSETFAGERKHELYRRLDYSRDCANLPSPSSMQRVASYTGAASGTRSRTDAGLHPRTRYCYEVRITDSAGAITKSPEVCLSTLGDGLPNFRSTAQTANEITVGWYDLFPGFQRFQVRRKPETPGWPFPNPSVTIYTSPVLTASNTCAAYTATDTGREPQTSSCYDLYGYRTSLNVWYPLATTCGTTTAGPPDMPGLTVQSVLDTSFTIVFMDRSKNEDALELRRCDATGAACVTLLSRGPLEGEGQTLSFAEAGLSPSTTYRYVGRATNALGSKEMTLDVTTTAPIPPPPTVDACGILTSCAAGYHLRSYQHAAACAGSGNNQTTCALDAGVTFNMCGLGACPAGYHVGDTLFDLYCDADGVIPAIENNATRCDHD